MQDIADVRRQLLVYEDTDEAWKANRLVLDYESKLQTLGALKIKEYRVLVSQLHEALLRLKKGKQPQLPDFIATIFVDEEDERPFKLTEEGILRKIDHVESRIQELRELLKLGYV